MISEERAQIFERRIDRGRYADLLRGKTVALVGGFENYASAVVGRHDLVVRLSNHWVENRWKADEDSKGYIPQDERGPLDIVYHNGYRDPAVLLRTAKDADIKFMVFNFHHQHGQIIKQFVEENDIPHEAYNHKPLSEQSPWDVQSPWLNELMAAYAFFPLTGVLSIHHLLRHPLSKLFVTGMNMYRNRNIGRVGPHVLHPHLDYLWEVYEWDSRLEYDEPLRLAVESGLQCRLSRESPPPLGTDACP